MNYHDHPALSRSGIKTFRDEGRRMFHARHVLRLPEAQKDPSDEMNLGTLCHAELLEPGSLEGQFAVLTEWPDFRTKAAREWRDAQKAAGKIVVKPEDIADQIAIVQSAVAVAGDFVTNKNAVVETPIHWTDGPTNLPCRCKPDWLIPRPGMSLVFDFKTTADASPSAFHNQIASLGLQWQHIHYMHGVSATIDTKAVDFIFVAVETKYPYRASLHRIHITQEMKDEYRRTLEAIAECYRTDDWREPWEDAIHEATVREWKLRSDAVVTA